MKSAIIAITLVSAMVCCVQSFVIQPKNGVKFDTFLKKF
jgi:hypothetical protein